MSEVDNWITREAYYYLFFAWFASCKPPFCMRGIRWGGEEDEDEELTLFQGERLHYCCGGLRENYGKITSCCSVMCQKREPFKGSNRNPNVCMYLCTLSTSKVYHLQLQGCLMESDTAQGSSSLKDRQSSTPPYQNSPPSTSPPAPQQHDQSHP